MVMMHHGPDECDSCNKRMKFNELEKAVNCSCALCGPWTICDHCHEENKRAREQAKQVNHDGLFEHECEEPGCTRIVLYDDEPKCFTHSPDEGSTVVGYSARSKK